MTRALLLSAALLAALAPASVGAEPSSIDTSQSLRQGIYWDALVEGGGGGQWNGSEPWIGLLGARGGVSLIGEPWFVTVGATVHWPPPNALAIGAQAEIMHLWSGLWFQAGIAADIGGHLVVTTGAGWSVLGIEGRFMELETGDPVYGLIGKLRIPINLIVMALE